MFEVQVEGNVEYSDVCLRYRVREMLCTVMCVCVCEVQGEGNVVYSDLCVCEVQGEGNVVYSDVCV